MDRLDTEIPPEAHAAVPALPELLDLRVALARFAAIDTLERIATTSDDPRERRRAATELLLCPIPGRRAARTSRRPAAPSTQRHAPRASLRSRAPGPPVDARRPPRP